MSITAPTDITGCITWLAKGDFVSSGGLISQWNDSSGNGYHWTQGTSGLRPKDITGAHGRGAFYPYEDATPRGLLSPAGVSLSQRGCSLFVVCERVALYENSDFMYSTAGGTFEPFYVSLAPPLPSSFAVAGTQINWPKYHGSNKLVWGARYGATPNQTLYVNSTAQNRTGAYANTSGLTTYTMGRTGGSNPWHGVVYEVVIYNKELSGTETTDILDYLTSSNSLTTTWTNQIVYAGDSRTAGVGSTDNQSYPWQSAYYASANKVFNYGLGGQTAATMDSQYTAKITPLYSASDFTKNVLVCWAGQNDLYNAGASPNGTTVYNSIASYCGKAFAEGWKVIVCTECDGSAASGANQAAYEAAKVTMNGLIVSNYTTFAHQIVRLDQAAQLSDRTNTTYFEPGATPIHLNNAGSAVVAGLVDAAIAAELNPGGGNGRRGLINRPVEIGREGVRIY